MSRMQQRGYPAAAWAGTDVLLAREIGVETDTGKFKIGDGATQWAALGYQVSAADLASGLSSKVNSSTYTAGLAGKASPSDVDAKITAIGLGSASTHAATDFDAAGAAAAIAASVAATYLTFDGTSVLKNGTVVPIAGTGGSSAVDNGVGGITFSSGATDNGLGGIAA